MIGLLLSSAALAAIVSKRIYWVRAEQGATPPRIVLHRISGNRDMHMGGPSGLVESRVQFDCYGTSYLSAKGVARAVEALLSGYSGTAGGTTFDGCFLVAERDQFEDTETADKLSRVSLDFIIWHKGA